MTLARHERIVAPPGPPIALGLRPLDKARPRSHPAAVPLPRLLLSAYARLDATLASPAVCRALDRVSGYVLAAEAFGNAALSFSIELPQQRLGALAPSLAAEGIELFDDAATELARAASQPCDDPSRDASAQLHVSLLHDGIDIPRPVPAIPGE